MRVGRQVRGDDVGGDREVDEQAALLAVLGQHRDAGSHGVRGAARPQLAAVDQHAAGLDRPGAEDRLADLGAPGAEQAGEADDLAVAQREGCRDHRSGGEVADLERDGGVRRGAARIGLEGELAPDHQRDQLAMRRRRRSRARP